MQTPQCLTISLYGSAEHGDGPFERGIRQLILKLRDEYLALEDLSSESCCLCVVHGQNPQWLTGFAARLRNFVDLCLESF